MDMILRKSCVSVTELKRHYASILAQAEDAPVAVVNRNRPEAYLVSAIYFERLLKQLEDLQDAQLIRERANGPFIEIRPGAL
jgi:antitoxin StbD